MDRTPLVECRVVRRTPGDLAEEGPVARVTQARNDGNRDSEEVARYILVGQRGKTWRITSASHDHDEVDLAAFGEIPGAF
jgi:hypothetical protein